MVNLVRTDFNQQGINALNTGMGIGNQIQNTQQIGIDRQRQADIDAQRNQMFEQKQGIMGQQSQMNQQAIEQQEQTQGMGELITALNLPFDKRNELFAELEQTRSSPDSKKYLQFLQTLDDKEQLTSMIQLLNSKQGGQGGKDKGLPAEAQAFNDLIKDFSLEEQKVARRIKAGLKGRAISNAELSAIESGDIKSYSDYKIQQKQGEKFAEATGAQRAKIIDKGFNSIIKIDSGIRNIDKAINAVTSGAGVGALEKLWPSIKASSVELDNIRGQMALDVVGATTFGALSKGELDLAKDIALPTGLDSAELTDYLQRKKTAQEKLRAYYNDQIQFLDQGGTVAGFLRNKERSGSQQQIQGGTLSNQDQQALQWAKANPDDPRSAQILNKLGVQ